MALVRSETLDHFLIRSWRETAPHDLGEQSGRLCVTAGTIAERNLRRTLSTADVPATQAADYTSIEDMARTIVSAHHGTRAAIVDGQLRRRTLTSIIDAAQSSDPTTALERLATRIEWDDDGYAQFADELDAYFRASNAGAMDTTERDHDTLAALAAELDDPFAEWRSREGLAAFAEVHEELLERMADLPDHVYLSRSHLVAAARAYLADEWSAIYPTVDWVGIATINVFDNPTIRFVREIDELADSPELNFFFRTGTWDSLVARLRAAGIDIREKAGYPPDPCDATADACAIARNEFQRSAPADTVQLVEAPDRRREVETVTARLRELFADDVPPEDVLLVARDAGTYRPLIEDVFTNNEFPYHVETRAPMANLPAYRFLKATVDLVAHQAATPGEPVDYTSVTDPLRLGFSLSGDPDELWPVPQREFLRLEEQLAAAQDRDGRRSIEEWHAFAEAQPETGDEWTIASAFLTWIRDEATRSMDTGAKLRDWADVLLRNHVRQTLEEGVVSPAGPMVDPSRRDLSAKHRSHYASRVRDQTGRLQGYFDRAVELARDGDRLATNPGWDLVVRTIGDVIGEETFGARSNDASAVRVVDAGNTYFLDAEYVFVLGLSAEEFPQELGTPTFVHEDLHDAAYRTALGRSPVSSHVFYESRTSQYEQELDLYEVATHSCTDSLTLLHNYLDSESDSVAWSSFVDFLNPDADEDEYVDRIRVDEWLPSTETADDDDAYWPRLAGRDRLRAYAFYASPTEHVAGPSIDAATLMRLALWTEADAYADAIEPRIDRLTTEAFTIPVGPTDASVSPDVDLTSIGGAPVLPHEADLFAQCELKYYFYQYLFARDGADVDRETIPDDLTSRPTSRYGRLPKVVRNNYVADRYREAIRVLVEDLVPERQGMLSDFSDPSAVIRWWQTNKPDDAPVSIAQSLVREYMQVQGERDAGIERDWTWTESQLVEVNGHVFDLGPHRVDTVTGDDGEAYTLPVFYVESRGAAEEAPKLCWTPPDAGDARTEFCTAMCQQCDDVLGCSVQTKFAHDHRLHGTAVGYDTPLGAVFIEQGVSAPSARQGYLVERGGPGRWPGSFESTLERIAPADWRTFGESWERDLSGHLVSMVPGDGVEYHVDRRFVDEGTDEYGNRDGSGDDGCAACVYRDLCQLPRKVNER